jgi:glycosyltransferase involved in cell wall biosynthesis
MNRKPEERVKVDGKFFRLDRARFSIKGVTYGPFCPDDEGSTFASSEQTKKDFEQINQLGANVLRCYYVPPKWLLDLAHQHQLKILVDVPWEKHRCFLDSNDSRKCARKAVRDAVRQCKGHPAFFGASVVNEIPAEIVRWTGPKRVTDFIDDLVDEAKSVDPEGLYTLSSFPPTEFVLPQNIDFLCFNVYLHQQKSFEGYLSRLQTLADAKPLLLGEFGLDSFRVGEREKCEILTWQIETAFRGGLSGIVVFSYTDDWWRGGHQIEDWAFGLTSVDRQPKESFKTVQKLYHTAPHFPLPVIPKVSVVVASYNGGPTLPDCLHSLAHLNYPNYEIILIDDGSTDQTPQIAPRYPSVRYIRQDNKGLSAARNAGIAAATGEIVAFTDSDCRADRDWLHYLVSDMLAGGFTGMGGHNFLPPEDSPVSAAVMASPGGPVHVMLTDREAEHIPGCNMAFYRSALQEIGGFDPIYRKAGDDVDICWRLQQAGYKIGFSHAGFVWHHRRATVDAYLNQQRGYGEAEAMLARNHPEYFNLLGGGIWRGRIYTPSKYGVILQRPIIYHGLFGSGFFQRLYTPNPAAAVMLCISLEFHCLVTMPLALLSIYLNFFWPLAAVSFLTSAAICVVAGVQAELPAKKQRWWSRLLVAWLFFLQPIVRGWARYRERMKFYSGIKHPAKKRVILPAGTKFAVSEVYYWSRKGIDRYQFLDRILKQFETQRWQYRADTGWNHYDAEVVGSTWSRLRLTTVSEDLGENKSFFRCRLTARWSWPAKLFFIAALGAELVAIDNLAEVQPWIWMILSSIPILYWFIEEEGRSRQQLICSLVDDAANTLELEKYRYEQRVPA